MAYISRSSAVRFFTLTGVYLLVSSRVAVYNSSQVVFQFMLSPVLVLFSFKYSQTRERCASPNLVFKKFCHSDIYLDQFLTAFLQPSQQGCVVLVKT